MKCSHVNFVVKNSQTTGTWIGTLLAIKTIGHISVTFVPKCLHIITNWHPIRSIIMRLRVMNVMLIVRLFQQSKRWNCIRRNIWMLVTESVMCALKGFLSKHQLVNHKLVHSGKKQFTCDICGSAFFYKYYLNVHCTCWAECARLQCEVCGSKFKLKGWLLKQVKSHTGFLCDVCGKTLLSCTSLETRHCVHTGQQPDVCDVCDKMFVMNSSLHLHLLTHIYDHPHVCDACGKSSHNPPPSQFTNTTIQV